MGCCGRNVLTSSLKEFGLPFFPQTGVSNGTTKCHASTLDVSYCSIGLIDSSNKGVMNTVLHLLVRRSSRVRVMDLTHIFAVWAVRVLKNPDLTRA